MLASIVQSSLTLPVFFLCTAVSLSLGLAIAAAYMFKNRYSKSFVVTLVLLPALVQFVIMMVNGNIGAGVAVAGTFSLVRFRSVAGGAKEISSIFFAMAIGLATGMGYIALAILFCIVIGLVMLLLSTLQFGEMSEAEKDLKITIPENLEYEGIFDDIFAKYTTDADLYKVKTSNMGTLYDLHYHITLRDTGICKAFLDELRCRNGNLNIVCGRKQQKEEL